ncbi:HAD-IA family hydrolase [Streptomyces sp. J2-1]|uniref:HAD family hydrolase n=1 Tax=Streptomyces corallincola TaxID=2851888 RepID=UPI001C386BA6|nr:HAD-IA family hydrolase [Streptomyces corallincola]MBV2357337.1 HAD-IA family hydrolase [Streptomyces corallincola]
MTQSPEIAEAAQLPAAPGGGAVTTRLVLFDLDGTLIDTPNAIVNTFTDTFASLGIHGITADAIRSTIGRPLAEAFAHLVGLPTTAAQVEAAVERYQVLYRERIVPQARTLLYSGVAEGLARLGSNGMILGVATSKFTASAEALLAAAGIRDHFDMVVGADAVTQPKPAPDAGLLIAAELGHHPSRAVMVGDTTHDVFMAHNANMRSIAVTYGIHTPAQLEAARPTWMEQTFPAAVDRILSGD